MRILSNTVVYVFTFDLCKRGWVEFINKSTQLMLKLKYNNYRVCLTDGLIFFLYCCTRSFVKYTCTLELKVADMYTYLRL